MSLFRYQLWGFRWQLHSLKPQIYPPKLACWLQYRFENNCSRCYFRCYCSKCCSSCSLTDIWRALVSHQMSNLLQFRQLLVLLHMIFVIRQIFLVLNLPVILIIIPKLSIFLFQKGLIAVKVVKAALVILVFLVKIVVIFNPLILVESAFSVALECRSLFYGLLEACSQLYFGWLTIVYA